MESTNKIYPYELYSSVMLVQKLTDCIGICGWINSFQEVLGWGHQNKQTACMAAGIAKDMLGSDGSADESVTILSLCSFEQSFVLCIQVHRGGKHG